MERSVCVLLMAFIIALPNQSIINGGMYKSSSIATQIQY